MEEYKERFIDFMVGADVLTFGDFTTKSGRQTPFFINTGKYRTGAQMAQLSDFYASAIHSHLGDSFDVLFGPAYKGIPLAVATSMALSRGAQGRAGQDCAFCFTRKEKKDHGEGGGLGGHSLKDGARVLIIEDVTTAGTSIRESVPLLRGAAKVELSGLVVSVDRMERGQGTQNALAELRDEFGLNTFAIVTIEEVMGYLKGRELNGKVVLTDAIYQSMQAYRDRYGGTV